MEQHDLKLLDELDVNIYRHEPAFGDGLQAGRFEYMRNKPDQFRAYLEERHPLFQSSQEPDKDHGIDR